MRQRVLRMLRTALGLGIIAVLIWTVDLHELLGVLRELTPSSIVALLLLSGVLILVSAWKWKIFLDTSEMRLSLGKLFSLYLIGYFINSFAPSFIGGDAVRSWYVGKRVGQHAAAAATILERFTGLFAMVTLGAAGVWLVERVTLEIRVIVMAMAVATLAGAAVVVSRSLSGRFERLLGNRPGIATLFGHIRRIQTAMMTIGSDRRRLSLALILSYLFHTLTVVNTLLAAWAVGWHTDAVIDLFVVLPLILLVGALPVAPSGLGIQEGAFYFFLQLVGATPAQALAVGIVLRAKGYVLALLGGILWVLMRGSLQATTAQPTCEPGRSS